MSSLPKFAEELKLRYLSGEAVLFILHSNVKDLVHYNNEYLPLQEFLSKALLEKSKDLVIFYNPSEGITFSNSSMKKEFFKIINARQMLLGEPLLDELPTSPYKVFNLLDKCLSLPNQKIALVINYAEMVLPSSELSFMNIEERSNLITIQRWASNLQILNSDNIIILITENLADINRKIVSNPQIISIEVPLPNTSERNEFIDYLLNKTSVNLGLKKQTLAEITSGLRLIQIDGLFRQASKSEQKTITFETIKNKKKEIIENECFGLVELVEPSFGLEHVGGMDRAKNILKNVVNSIKEGDTKSVPMGIFFVGPMGTGKTFLAEAFAKESGLTCIKLKNFRDKWVGSTEANLEKILNIIKALGSVIVIIDEVDRALGGDNEGDSGTSSRVYAKIKAFMSDTSHRGKILWIIMSNRPDKIDIDLKRPGRFDLKIPFFFPQTIEERESIIKAIFKKNSIEYDITDWSILDSLKDYSGAELEAIALLSREFAKEQGSNTVTVDYLKMAIDDFIPNRNSTMIEFMELLAVQECSSKRLLPDKYKDLDNNSLALKLYNLKKMIN